MFIARAYQNDYRHYNVPLPAPRRWYSFYATADADNAMTPFRGDRGGRFGRGNNSVYAPFAASPVSPHHNAVFVLRERCTARDTHLVAP